MCSVRFNFILILTVGLIWNMEKASVAASRLKKNYALKILGATLAIAITCL
jgi:hypothetical protein